MNYLVINEEDYALTVVNTTEDAREEKERLQEHIEQYKANPSEEALVAMKSNIPEGLRLTIGVSTSYAQLKTMMYQRQDHRLPCWREFCQWIALLPYAVEMGVTA